MTGVRVGRVEHDGGVLEYEVAGAGPEVAFLHPGLWDRRTWDDQFEVFARAYRVLRLDARGYGRSSRLEPGRPYSPVDDLGAVMDAAGFARAALVGCSIGGGTALEFAVEHPDRVAALVLVATALPGLEEGTPEEEAWWDEHGAPVRVAVEAGDLERAQDLRLRTMWAMLGVDEGAGRRIRDIAFDNLHELTMDESGTRHPTPSAYERLGDVAAPTLVVAPDHDPPETRVCRLVADRIPNARFVQIPRTDHVVNMRRPDEFNRVALEFLGEVLG
jgi:pimeloyl-ACP methyl ester carboxylesterase